MQLRIYFKTMDRKKLSVKEKQQRKTAFKAFLQEFAEKVVQLISIENGEWSVKGFIDIYKNVYTISSDTKIISKILEIHIFPHLSQITQ